MTAPTKGQTMKSPARTRPAGPERKQPRPQSSVAAAKPEAPAQSHGLRKTALTKQGKAIELLRRPEGATLEMLVKETGWQKHSLRGFMAGTVRKKLKLSLSSEKTEGIRTYRIRSSKVLAKLDATKKTARRIR